MPIVAHGDFKLHAVFTWRGDDWFNDLLPKLRAGVQDAAKIYRNEVFRRLQQNVGSRSVGTLKRLRVTHSAPGQPPFAQTFNLALSVRNSFNFNLTRGRNTIIKGRISTDVSYAPTLEFGGAFSADPARKKWSRIRLVNPLRSTPFISPRPVWRPVFVEKREEMLFALTRRISVLGG